MSTADDAQWPAFWLSLHQIETQCTFQSVYLSGWSWTDLFYTRLGNNTACVKWTLLIRSCIKSPWYSKHKPFQKQQEGIVFIGAEVISLLAALIFSDQKDVNKQKGHMLSFPRITGCPCASKWAISMFCFHVNAEQGKLRWGRAEDHQRMKTLPTCEAALTKLDDSEWNILFCCCVYVINPMAFLSSLTFALVVIAVAW